MKASLSWLSQYVSIDMDASDLAEALTMAGLEVDSVTDRYEYLNTVLVGRIVEIVPHPNAQRLTVCKVDTGDRLFPVVCGAPNVAVNMLAPLALPGTQFLDGTVLNKTTIRGETSEGMLCSEVELGLGNDRSGILSLDSSLEVGRKFPQALSLSDPVFEIDLTPNRPDCLCILGIAREIAAIQNISLTYPDIPVMETDGEIADHTSVTIEAPDHCPRYAARLLTGIAVAPSPFWLQDRLNSVGLRPINNIVDVTNFVMMEMGQPLHAFDFDRLAENRIVVRTATIGEAFTTLDGKERELTNEMLMICDGEKPVAVGGVMGGLNSEIGASTQRVLIESAYFNPPSIRKTAKKLSLGTDASHRFERGVDPESTVKALDRAARLMVDVSDGKLISGAIDAHPKKSSRNKVMLSVNRTNRFLGTDLSQETMIKLLESIEFEVNIDDAATLTVVHPSFRVDIQRPVDLMEEIARLSGYNDIPTTFPPISAGTKLPSRDLDIRNNILRIMTGFGFTEAINYSFMNELSCDKLRLPADDYRRRVVKIFNPLTEDQTAMRTSLIPGLLETMHRNASQQIRDLKLFETGKVFINNSREELPDEVEILAGLWTGLRKPVSWHSAPEECGYYDIKGVVEGLFHALKIRNVRYSRMPDDLCFYMRPGHTAQIRINHTIVGWVGEINDVVLDHFDLKQTAFIFELDVNRLSHHITELQQARSISKYPAISRDITLIIDKSIESGDLLIKIREFDEALVESIELFSVFEGDPIPAGKKSVSVRITYRSIKETLQDEAINQLHKDITDRLIKAYHASLPI